MFAPTKNSTSTRNNNAIKYAWLLYTNIEIYKEEWVTQSHSVN